MTLQLRSDGTVRGQGSGVIESSDSGGADIKGALPPVAVASCRQANPQTVLRCPTSAGRNRISSPIGATTYQPAGATLGIPFVLSLTKTNPHSTLRHRHLQLAGVGNFQWG